MRRRVVLFVRELAGNHDMKAWRWGLLDDEILQPSMFVADRPGRGLLTLR